MSLLAERGKCGGYPRGYRLPEQKAAIKPELGHGSTRAAAQPGPRST